MINQVILVIDDNRTLLEGLGDRLQRDERSVILCADLEGAKILIDHLPITHVVSDIRLTGPFAFEGLGLVQYVRERSPATFVILMTGLLTPGLRIEARNRGSVAFLEKPFAIEEVEKAVSQCGALPLRDCQLPALMMMPMLDEILAGSELTTCFQPIRRISVAGNALFGFECLSRLRTESPLRNSTLLFRYAADKQRVAELECKCMSQALREAGSLGEKALLFLNAHPNVFAEGPRLLRTLHESEIPMNRLVIEITEQAPMRDDSSTWDTIAALRRSGVRFAFDDVGMAYSHFQHLGRVQPAFLKVSQDFGTGFERDHVKETIVRSILQLANNLSIQLILEGIEDDATLVRAVELGIPLGQGYLLGRPATMSSHLDE